MNNKLQTKNPQSFFPYPTIRKIQDKLIESVSEALQNKKNLLVHAPTGLGKTAATLAPALEYAEKKNHKIFFLTSRHTQHKIVVDTLTKIRKKFNLELTAVSIVGKKWMCCQSGIESLKSGEFSEYCKLLKEEENCEFYSNLKKKNKKSIECKKALQNLLEIGIVDSETIISESRRYGLCPYEIAMMLSKKAKVIISDYSYIFNPSIRNKFFTKIEHGLENSIIIVDEAHNLPNRVRDLMTVNLSSLTIRSGIKESRKIDNQKLIGALSQIQDILNSLANGLRIDEERLTRRDDFIEEIQKIKDYPALIEEMEENAERVRKKQKRSFLGSVAHFLEEWPGEDDGFVRIISHQKYRNESYPVLSYKCLDPALVTKEVMENSAAIILMSGTLTPPTMFRDLLGVKNCIEKEFESGFDKKNKLSLIVPQTTTKYTSRTEEEFRKIGEICSRIIDMIPGNSAVFFPSYALKNAIGKHITRKCKKTVFEEHQKLSKQDKAELLENFKKCQKSGGVLLGVAAGSFGEGIDLPGDMLKGVIVVGLPLSKPNLEIQKLIEYYDKKFNKGWSYGYILPAITKCLQNAGRCIRSESDKGVIVFLDRRYTSPDYIKCFPKEWDLKITNDYMSEIESFFST